MPPPYPNTFCGHQLGDILISDATHSVAAFYDASNNIRVWRWPVNNPASATAHAMNATEKAIMGLDDAGWIAAQPGTGADEEHDFIALGEMSDGKYVIAAHMHVDPFRCLITDTAGDISSWSELPTIGSEQVNNTYPMFIKRPDGTLRLFIRDGVSTIGAGKSNASIRDESAGTFGARQVIFQGLEVPDAAPGPSVGNDSTSDLYNWSPYPAKPFVEDIGGGDWIEHWYWLWRELGSGQQDSDCFYPSYMQYRSATDTWHAVDGTTVTLPVTPLQQTVVQTGTLPDTITYPGTEYINTSGICIDGDGYPHILTSKNPTYHLWWDGAAWQQEDLLSPFMDGVTFNGPPLSLAWWQGHIWFLGVAGGGTNRRCVMARSDGAVYLNVSGFLADPVGGWVVTYDPEALRLRGTVEVMTPTLTEPRLWVSPQARF